MNLILFESDEIGKPLARTDVRCAHILRTLRMKAGDRFDAGVIDGARGKALILGIGKETLTFKFDPRHEPSAPDPIDVLVGLVRPQSARRVLYDASALGVRRLSFATTGRSDPNYARSSLWTSGEWRRHLIDGAQQAFETRIPVVSHDAALQDAMAAVKDGIRIALDNYEAQALLHEFLRSTAADPASDRKTVTLAFGPERGWDAGDRALLRSSGFTLASLGRRVMRVETAIASAIAIVRAHAGWQ